MFKFVNVLMLAFRNGEVRKVAVPLSEWNACSSVWAKLEKVFYYGQNDFSGPFGHEQKLPSVSVGDVVLLDGKAYRVADFGFVEMSARELESYRELPNISRMFYEAR